MPHTVYILRSDKTGRTYVGFCEDVHVRLHSHNSGHVAATRNGRPWRILWTEEIADYSSARNRERYFKTGGGRRWIAAHLFEVP
jgi:predicted GIY-YIG superfamily endonuclease